MRAGDQGHGREIEVPYEWNEDRDIVAPHNFRVMQTLSVDGNIESTPAPTGPNHLTNKNYVDTQLASRTQITSVPSSATAAGTPGQIAYDSNYVYVCIATNTWRRSVHASW